MANLFYGILALAVTIIFWQVALGIAVVAIIVWVLSNLWRFFIDAKNGN